MAKRFDFVSASDKPALLAITTPEWLSTAESALTEIGYKIQKIGTHLEFAGRFSQVPYQVVIIEEQFAGTPLAENMTLKASSFGSECVIGADFIAKCTFRADLIAI